MSNTTPEQSRRLSPYLSAFGAVALAYGSCVGWGAFVMPGTTFLPTAGPLGSLIGMGAGTLIMLIFAGNYHAMMQHYPDEGGAYTYVKHTFGHDHAYLCAWFLILTYVAILWANATAIVLIARNLAGDIFQTGFHYQVIGYDIYLGEVAVTILAVVLSGLLCISAKRLAAHLESLMAVILFAGILICFFAALRLDQVNALTIRPLFAKDASPVIQIIYIVALVPWAFVGFESVSHAAAELFFPVKKAFRIMAAACIGCGLSYALPATIAAAVRPDGYASWMAYIADADHLPGLQGMPVLYAAGTALGRFGHVFLTFIILCAVLTSLIGNYTAASRLLYAMAKDRILPARYALCGKYGTPQKAILLIMGVSSLIPFLGRTAIGWIVDVTTIGATITYGYTSAAAYRTAKETNNRTVRLTGIAGVILAVVFGLFIVAPDFLAAESLATESYLIFTVWGLLGFIYFRILFGKDTDRRYGKTIFVWVVLLLVLLFSSLMWMRKATAQSIAQHVTDGTAYSAIYDALTRNSLIQAVLIVLSLGLLLSIYAVMRKRETLLEREKRSAEESSEAKSTFLSNMSHEIRTPINAVLGMNEMILREAAQNNASEESLRRITNYAGNVESASKNLLSIINDILDFSKIEAGKMEVVDANYKLSSVLNDVTNMVLFRARDKGLAFHVRVDETLPDDLYGDEVRVRQVVTNVLTNAVKYTQQGSVSFDVSATDRSTDRITLVFRIEDTGIGIRKEDLGKLFGKFERMDLSKNKTVEGTGLGLAITKNLLALMGGEIDVQSEYGKGSVFTVTIPEQVTGWEPIGNFHEKFERAMQEKAVYHESFRAPSAHILVVDDTEMNLTVVEGLLEKTQVQIDTALSGKEALQLTEHTPFDLILMDQRMPEMDGTEALLHIRNQTDGVNKDTPVLCLTADAVSGAREKYLAQGFTDYLSKPVEGEALEKALVRYLPAEKVVLQTVSEDEIAASGESPLRAFYGQTDLLDYERALSLCGSEKVLEKTLRQFSEAISQNADAIAAFLAENDYRSYAIKVHALKSSAKLIGAFALSDRAKVLEETADDPTAEAVARLKSETPSFLSDYRGLSGVLAPWFDTPTVSHKNTAPVSEASLAELYLKISHAAEEFDADEIDLLLSETDPSAIPDTAKEKWQAVNKAASGMDWDALEKALAQ